MNQELGDFFKAEHTVILSDMHMTEAEPIHPRNPLWKKYKRKEFFVDESFKFFLETIQKEMKGSIELILNGDIFDYDSVMTLPEKSDFKVSWLEKKRGLFSEVEKSRFKTQVILSDHDEWVKALREFILNGHHVVMIIGNHDIELHWPEVQQDILKALELSDEFKCNFRFCEWFYISNGDTLIEHGNQYDAYTVCQNPINPLIKVINHEASVRLPFGNLADRYMINGMGFFNPHVDSSFIKSNLKEYISFFVKYIMKTEPLLAITWFWGAMVTLLFSVREGLLPALVDPMSIVDRVEMIAKKSNSTTQIVRALNAVHVHPAIFNPFKILRELWLDRALFFVLIVWGCFQFYSILNIFTRVSFLWFSIPLILVMPFFIMYAQSVESEIHKLSKKIAGKIGQSATLAGVERVVLGHTHKERFIKVDEVELINSGTWSAAYEDVECTRPLGRKCFVWIFPNKEAKGGRQACLNEWTDDYEIKLLSDASNLLP